MEIKENSLVYQLWAFATRMKLDFFHHKRNSPNSYYRESFDQKFEYELKTMNLCSVMRRILFGIPFFLTLYGLVLFGVYQVVFAVPNYLFGLTSFYGTIFDGILILFMMGFGFFTFWYTCTKLGKFLENTPDIKTPQFLKTASKEVGGFFKMIFTWISDAHDGICRKITLVRKETENV